MSDFQSGYWSGKNGEINGSVTNSDGKVVFKLEGKWHDSITCNISGDIRVLWKPREEN